MTPTLLYAGIISYDDIRQRPQWIADGLAKTYRVLYLNPFCSVFHGLSTASSRHVKGSLCWVAAASGIPLSGYLPVANRFNAAQAAKKVGQQLDALGWPKPQVFIATFPKHWDLLRYFPTALVVYDVMDDYPQFFDPLQAAVLTRMHKKLLECADVVTASSSILADRYAQWARGQIVVIENAVPAGFARACASASPAAELDEMPSPRFGYVGTVGKWIDFDALSRLARAHPGGSVILIGPITTRVPNLPDNVHLRGSRPHDAVPGLLRGFDVGLVPFRASRLIDGVNPVKVYEYLAAGLPVLSTPFAGIERFGETVKVAPAADWPNAVSECRKPAQVPAEYTSTWDDRVAAIRREISIDAGSGN